MDKRVAFAAKVLVALSACLSAHGDDSGIWQVVELDDMWGEPSDERAAEVAIDHPIAKTATLRVDATGVGFKFGYLKLAGEDHKFMRVRVGDGDKDKEDGAFVVEDTHDNRLDVTRDLWDGFLDGKSASQRKKTANRNLTNAVLEGVKRGDGNVRVLLEYQGEERTMFTFPLVNACPALIEAGVLKDSDCES